MLVQANLEMCTCGAVIEDPVIVLGPVESVEVLVDDPVLRLLRVGALGPLVGERPHVAVQR